MAQIQTYLPTITTFLATKIDIIIFTHSLAWIFLLSSIIPSVLLGKERSVLAQFGVCLTLASFAFTIQDALTGFDGTLDNILGLGPLFQNLALATADLSVPFLMIIGFNIRGKREREDWLTRKKNTESIEDSPL